MSGQRRNRVQETADAVATTSMWSPRWGGTRSRVNKCAGELGHGRRPVGIMTRCKVDRGEPQTEADRCGEGEPEPRDDPGTTLAGVPLQRGQDDADCGDHHAGCL